MSFKVKALYEYSSAHEDDLKFGVGQIITITDEEDADWYGGEYIDETGIKQEGIFPRNFVEKYEPTAPPRPTRARPKKEAEPAPAAEEPQNGASAAAPERAAVAEELVHRPPVPAASVPAASPAPVPAAPVAPATPSSTVGRKPSVSLGKPPPPPVSEKPSSFRDRIAAFNKPAAPPVAPFKPSGLSGGGSAGFIKKPFVAPPPSRNAYVPPQREAPVAKIYRREEDPEVKEMEAETLENAEKAGLIPGKSDGAEEDHQSKPTSLKERIALLQKQQMEAAQRHAEALAKKEKTKKPSISKRSMSSDRGEGGAALEEVPPLPTERGETESVGRRSVDEPRPTSSHHRRKLSKSIQPDVGGDGNEADVAEAGETREALEDVAENEEGDRSRPVKRDVPVDNETEVGDEDEGGDEEEEEEDEIDPEVRRKEELRARMAKMSGGMGMAGMFGIVPMSAPAPPRKKKSITSATSEPADDESPSRAPPVPTMMALPGFSARQSEDAPREEPAPSAPAPPAPKPVSRGNASIVDEAGRKTPESSKRKSMDAPPPVPGGRPAPPPVPLELRSLPPPPPAELTSQRSGSESDDEMSERAPATNLDTPKGEAPPRIRSPPAPIPPQSPGFAAGLRSPSIHATVLSEEFVSPPASPRGGRRNSRPPPPVPGAPPPIPSSSSRPPPPPPPPVQGDLSRQSTADVRLASPIRTIPRHQQDDEGEVTEYEGDYDTDIASSVPHKEALRSHHGHVRTPSVDDASSTLSPASEIYPAGPPPPPPVPAAAPPRAVPPPVPAQSMPTSRRSSDARRSLDAPRPQAEEYDPYNYTAPKAVAGPASFALSPKIEEEEDAESATPQPVPAGPMLPMMAPPRGPPPAPTFTPTPPPANWPGHRQSLDVQRPSPAALSRRSQDMTRPSIDSGFIAEDLDLGVHSGWWKQANQVPPLLQGRRDILAESTESTSTNNGAKTVVTREVRVLFIDYSQTIITVQHDAYDQQDVDVSQRHEPPPRALRQDQLEQAYERYGMHIAEAVAGKKDTVVGDGTPLGLVHELLRPWKDVLAPVGTRAFGALVYANLANASTHQNDEIRKGDIITIRNARFQGKHGPMHAKYSMEVGKPDHVAVVAEWDGTKKKVRAWEQGRESRKVKLESFKLDDLRSGEVKVWRVMSRGWVGWSVQP